MTPALIQSPSDTGTETGNSSDDPHSRGIRPLDQLTGLAIGLAALLLPLSVVLADSVLPLTPAPTPSWTGYLLRQS